MKNWDSATLFYEGGLWHLETEEGIEIGRCRDRGGVADCADGKGVLQIARGIDSSILSVYCPGWGWVCLTFRLPAGVNARAWDYAEVPTPLQRCAASRCGAGSCDAEVPGEILCSSCCSTSWRREMFRAKFGVDAREARRKAGL
jgi:hypothetical protein